MLLKNLFKKTNPRLTQLATSSSSETQDNFHTNSSLHSAEKEQFLNLVSQIGDPFTDDQKKVMDIFLEINGHLSAEYIRKELSTQNNKPDMDCIVNTLEMFCRYGFAQKHTFNGTGTLYEHLHIGVHHDHLLCRNCGKVVEFFNSELEQIQQSVVKQHQFSGLHHKLTIQGLCPTCQKNRKVLRALPESINGERLKIINFASDRQISARLRALGLAVGDIINVINSADPLIIAKDHTRLALAANLAAHITVRAIN